MGRGETPRKVGEDLGDRCWCPVAQGLHPITQIPCQANNRASPGPPRPPAAPSSVSKKGRRKWARPKQIAGHRLLQLRPPGAQCPAALTLAQGTLDSLPGRPRETHRAGVAESRPPATAPGHLASLLSLSPRTSRHKEALPGQVLSAGDHGQEALCLRAWELQGDGGALCPRPVCPPHTHTPRPRGRPEAPARPK